MKNFLIKLFCKCCCHYGEHGHIGSGCGYCLHCFMFKKSQFRQQTLQEVVTKLEYLTKKYMIHNKGLVVYINRLKKEYE